LAGNIPAERMFGALFVGNLLPACEQQLRLLYKQPLWSNGKVAFCVFFTDKVSSSMHCSSRYSVLCAKNAI
jgi:hypothetical protein